MRLRFLIVLFMLLAAAVPALAETFVPLNIDVKKIYEKPGPDSKVVFEIPIEAKLLGYISGEAGLPCGAAWHKVKISFDFFGHHEYVGWIRTR